MKRRDAWHSLVIIVSALLVVTYVTYCTQIVIHCDGQVVKNALDFPVCLP